MSTIAVVYDTHADILQDESLSLEGFYPRLPFSTPLNKSSVMEAITKEYPDIEFVAYATISSELIRRIVNRIKELQKEGFDSNEIVARLKEEKVTLNYAYPAFQRCGYAVDAEHLTGNSFTFKVSAQPTGSTHTLHGTFAQGGVEMYSIPW